MSAQDFNKLWLAIDVLEAQEHLASIKALTFPQLKKEARAERNRQLYKMAYPRDIYKKETKDSSFLLQKLGGNSGRR